jgi:hypothetical protein
LTKRDCHNVSIGLAGLPGLLQKLRRSHESSPRIFKLFTLEPLVPDERREVLEKAIEEAHAKNPVEVTMTQGAKDNISFISEGYPHFIQQFGYSAFEEDSDNCIDADDVMEGAFKENGALQQLGQKYFEDLYFDQIGSDEYREVLRAMSEHFDEWVAKEQIRQASKLKETTLNNAIRALTTRNIIKPMKGKRGVYCLPNRSFAVWIRAYTQPRTQMARTEVIGSSAESTADPAAPVR